ncbi:hypothetical protein HNP46_001446 [Pseudomonas nitritireducens]|uniref:DUF4352 domain-containing protein n=1 Tax=Pseudomonas nitroreducens TaxID=46680 RepID=A0A7W7KGU4_PSENT|nr:hypothetical protein [Pseudomonas nitritireducens]MBB4862602.1 hypothetical protein [Pseudomonas nitritireducens]
MNRISLLTLALLAALGTSRAFAEDAAAGSSALKDSAKAAVSSAISAGKNLLGGVSDGVTEGRESAQGSDGSIVVSSLAQMEGQVSVQLLKVESSEDGNLTALLGFKNATDKPLRLINLRQTGALLAIDEEGYSSSPLSGPINPDDVTIPAKTGVRQKFVFEGPTAAVQSIRLWGRDFEVKR